MKLCLNMIVKDESAIIARCLNSVIPYITAAVIVDTGSTDNTIEIIERTLAAAEIPFRIHRAPFVNFMQARNEALEQARYSDLNFENILLVDADMELVVEDETCFDNLTGPSYDILQKAGTLSYINRRVVNRFETGNYRGVTHEYLDVASAGVLSGVHFLDHACGANRADKFKRDIDLLLADLKVHPDNERSWFYLAQSYRDNGQPAQAAQAYKRRVEMGGWDEEVWNARVNHAACLESLGDTGGFIRETLAAYNFRPSRAEPLYDLAKFFRERGDNYTSLLFSERGLAIPKTKDGLFVNDHVYQSGLREEYSICAFYDPARRDEGFRVTNDLALDLATPEHSRQLAKNNLYFYLKPLYSFAPSFKSKRINFKSPDGYIAMNPSIANVDGLLMAIIRTVNYTITSDGRYEIRAGDGSITDDNPIDTRNYLVQLDSDLEITFTQNITWERPEAKFKAVIGLEDMRLFSINGDLYANACVREQTEQGWCEQVSVRLRTDGDSPHSGGARPIRATEPLTMLPEHRQNEKNWMNWEGTHNFVYRLGTLINPYGEFITQAPPPYFVDTISGSSQAINIESERRRLAVVHEARHRPDTGQRYYNHRFALMDETGALLKLSLPFVLHDKQIEFVAGLCWHPEGDRLLISYGIRDEEAWIAEISYTEVLEMLK